MAAQQSPRRLADFSALSIIAQQLMSGAHPLAGSSVFVNTQRPPCPTLSDPSVPIL